MSGFDRLTVFIREFSTDDHNKVDQRPNAKPSECQDHEDAGSDFACVEAMNAKESKEEAE
jgi:hypothetical protein